MRTATESKPANVPEGDDNGARSELSTFKFRGNELVVTHDESQFANLLDTARFAHVYKLAEIFASSNMVPECFRKQTADCFIAMQMALRLGVDPFMFLQNTYVVHGRPGMEAKLGIALINSSGQFKDPIDYEIQGSDPFDSKYRVRAFAVRRSTGKVIEGPWVDWKTVKAERWDSKDGSKWKTIPQLMFLYRAAMWFGRAHCPERLMGMQAVDELEDVGVHVRQVDSVVKATGTAALRQELAGPPAMQEAAQDEPQDAPGGDEPQPEAPEPEAAATPQDKAATYTNLESGVEALAIDRGVGVRAGRGMLKAWLMKIGYVGRTEKIPPNLLREAARDAEAAAGAFEGLKKTTQAE